MVCQACSRSTALASSDQQSFLQISTSEQTSFPAHDEHTDRGTSLDHEGITVNAARASARDDHALTIRAPRDISDRAHSGHLLELDALVLTERVPDDDLLRVI